MSDPTTNTITYGDHVIDVANLPTKSIAALLRRGVSHFLGNEQASKVAAKFDDAKVGTGEGEYATEAALKAAKDSAKTDYVAAAIKALYDGTIGDSSRGPRGSTIDTVIRGLAEKEVRKILADNKLTMPTGDKVVKFPSGEELNRNDLITRRIAKHGDRLRKEAEAEMRKLDKVAKAEGGLGDL